MGTCSCLDTFCLLTLALALFHWKRARIPQDIKYLPHFSLKTPETIFLYFVTIHVYWQDALAMLTKECERLLSPEAGTGVVSGCRAPFVTDLCLSSA